MPELHPAQVADLVAERHRLNHLLSGSSVDEEISAPDIISRISDVDADLQPTYQPALQRLVTLDYAQFAEEGARLAFDYGRPELLKDISFAGKLTVGNIIASTSLELRQIKQVAGRPNIGVSPKLDDKLGVGFLIWTDEYGGSYPPKDSTPKAIEVRRRNTVVGKQAILSALDKGTKDSQAIDSPFGLMLPMVEAYEKLGEFTRAEPAKSQIRYVATNIAKGLASEVPGPEVYRARTPLALRFLKEHYPAEFDTIYDDYATSFNLMSRQQQALSIATSLALAENPGLAKASEAEQQHALIQQFKSLLNRQEALAAKDS